ncbi:MULTISPECIES: VanZ family protein [Paenibacillus]|nr:VanZ family protein [Paenibacillus xylanilyticus]
MTIIVEEGSRKRRHGRKRRVYGFILSLLLIAAWVLVIWSMSNQSYQQQTIQPWLHQWSEKVKIGFVLPDVQFTYGEHDYSLRQRPYDFAEFIFRKSAHLFVYAVLAVLVFGGLRYRKMHMLTCIAASLIVVAIIASIDEYIQQFSPNRTSSIRDIGVDLIGGFCGITIYVAMKTMIRKRRSRRHSSTPNK